MLPPLREDETLPLPPGGRRSSALRDVLGRYQLITEIAQGGMGAVYRARDPELDRLLAIKVLRAEHCHNPDMRRRFLEEARIAGQLQHPGVVPIHDIGYFADNRPYFTMKLVEGQTLSELLARRSSPSEDQAQFVGIFEHVCQTMAYAHSRRVLHRDLKPANVMVGAFGEVQIMDWGLAKILPTEAERSPPLGHEEDTIKDLSLAPIESCPSLTLAGSIVGTPAYMPPEQARGETIDERADVFGLGGMLCEILTGHPTYRLPRSMSEWLIHQERNLSDARERLQACDADHELIELARSCLEESPGHRPRHAGEVANRLVKYRLSVEERLRAAEVERAAAESRAEAAKARARASRLRAVLTIGVILLLGGSLAVAGYFYEKYLDVRQRITELLRQSNSLIMEARQLNNQEESVKAWQQALGMIERAKEAESGSWITPTDLSQRIEAAKIRLKVELHLVAKDHELLERLFEIRLQREDTYTRDQADQRYQEVFREFGLDLEKSQNELVLRVRSRPQRVVREIVSALDDWSRERRRKRLPSNLWQQPLRLAMRIDSDPWRNQLREALLTSGTTPLQTELLAVNVFTLWNVDVINLQLLYANLRTLERLRILKEYEQKADVTTLPPDSLHLLALFLQSEGQSADAIRLLREAQQRHPDHLWINSDLGAILYDQSAEHHDEAIRYLTAARAIRPEIGHTLAHALCSRDRYDEAIIVFQDLVRLHPDNAMHHRCLAMTLIQTKRYAEGERILRRAIELEPGLTAFRYDLAELYLRQNRLDDAENQLREVYEELPNHSTALFNLSVLLREQKRYSEVEQLLREHLKTYPRDEKILFQLAIVNSELGKIDEASQNYRKILSLNPNLAEAHTNLASMLFQQKKYRQMEEHLRKAIEIKPTLSEARFTLGSLLMNQGRLQESIAHLRWAVMTNPALALNYARLGEALQRDGQVEDAKEVFLQATKRFPQEADFAFLLGNLLSQQGNADEAIRWMRRAVKTNPDFPEANCNLGHLLRDQGNFAEGFKYLQRGHELGSSRPNWRYPSGRWLAEITAMIEIDERLAGMIQGTYQPSNPLDWLVATRICCCKKQYVQASRCFLKALSFSVDQQADFEQGGLAAAYASLGLGEDAGELSATEKLELRRLALTWLTRDRNLLKRLLDSRHPPAVALAKSKLRVWLGDDRLKPLRESNGLPSEERRAWEQFWAEVRRSAK